MEKEVVANLKSLGIDMINKAGSGHPGIVLSAANIIYTVYGKHMNINVSEPNWLGRDRFVLSAGHGSALLYSVLYMCGFLTLDDLKKFRQLGSITPGHPEYSITPGVEVSTGPLGQGVASAVGMAIGAKHLGAILQNPPITDYYIYTLCGDGDLMEGISTEAASLAGTLKLNNLIILYDSNQISLDGSTNYAFTENVCQKFEAMGWFTQKITNKIADIDKAINRAKKSGFPSLIEVKTTIGEGSLLEGQNIVHGKPLTSEDIKQLKNKLNIPNEDFYVNDKAVKYFRENLMKRSQERYIKWQNDYKNYLINASEKNKIFLKQFEGGDINFFLSEEYLSEFKEEAVRDSNFRILNLLSSKTDLLFGGSADLASSTKTYLDNEGNYRADNYIGKNIWYGVREHAMGAISNGLALTGFMPFCSTFLTFSDYLKPAIRMSALMKLPVTYIFTHDSVSIGEDGPTHQPIEQLAMLRSIPGFTVYRPADLNEVLGCWQSIVTLKRPSALIISKNKTYNHKETKASEVINGGYIVKKEEGNFDAILVATGTEVDLALTVAEELKKEGFDFRVVSMPSTSLFNKMDKEYKYNILPIGKKTFFIEAGSSFGLRNFVSNEKYLITLNEFGISGSSIDVLNHVKFDKENIKRKIKDLL